MAVVSFQQFGVSVIRKMILANMGGPPGIEVFVRKLKTILTGASKQFPILLDGVVQTGKEHLFGRRWRHLEGEGSQGTYFRNQAEEKTEKTRAYPGLDVFVIPIFLICGN